MAGALVLGVVSGQRDPKIFEGPSDKESALDSLARIVRSGEGPGVIDHYERAAWALGASASETEETITNAAEDFARSVTIGGSIG